MGAAGQLGVVAGLGCGFEFGGLGGSPLASQSIEIMVPAQRGLAWLKAQALINQLQNQGVDTCIVERRTLFQRGQ